MTSARATQTLSVSVQSATPTVYLFELCATTRTSLELLIHRAGWKMVVLASETALREWRCSVGPACLVTSTLPTRSTSLGLEHAGLPVVVLGERGDVPAAVRAIKTGAIGFVTRPINETVLLRTIVEAIEQSVADLNEQAERTHLRADYIALSERERQVMTLITTGLLNKQAGFELGISEITVKAHRGQVMRKMKAGSFAELVRMAVILDGIGVLTPPSLQRTNGSRFSGRILSPVAASNAVCLAGRHRQDNAA